MRAEGPGPSPTPIATAPRQAEERRAAWRTLYYLAVGALAALVPLILFAGLWIRGELAKGQQELETYLAERAGALSRTADSEIREQFALLSTIGALPSLDRPDLDTFRAQAARLVAAGPRWSSLALVDAGTGGALVDPVGSGAAGPPDPAAVREAADARRPVVRVASAGGGRPEATLYVPVLREGAVPSVLVAATPSSAIESALVAASSSNTLTLLVDGGGRILAHSRSPDLAGREAHPSLREAIDGTPAGVFAARTSEGQEVFTAFRRSPLTGWTAVAALDRSRYASPLRRSTVATVAAGLLSLILAAVLAIVLSYNVVQRRVNAERLAASRALGELDARLLAATQDALAEQRKAATEREVLLREIYHRVKNNLQIVQSLLRLASRDLSPEQQEPFEAAVRRIGAMARVHTLLYNAPDLASVDLRDYLDDLLQEVALSFDAEERGIAVVLEAQPMRIPLDTAVPLAFIAVELLTNAFRHAFPDDRGGTVRVRAHEEGGRGVLEVSDDGIGFPSEPPRRRSLGLTIVTQLVRQIEGELTNPAPGTSTTRITFSLAPKAAPPLPGLPAAAE
ncbi:MAG TPA: sensor histidine kinase [Salinarimonas sp.]|jgi:two-component sensor histidine kinase|nr:sensor histidine kinase [Salinarimonas sp.]